MNIDHIVKNVLKESLQEKAKELTKKIIKESSKQVCEQCGSELQEGECMECGSMKEEFFEEDTSAACESYKYHLNNFGEDDERTIQYQNKCESSKESSDDELEEELHGGQHKLDVAEPKGKLTSADFKKLRSKKGKKSEEKESWGAIARAAVPMAASYIGSKMGENNEETEMEEGNAFTGALAKARKEGDDEFKVGDKKFTTKESINNKLKLTESELIDLIESIVLEEKEKKVLDKKKPKGYTEYEKNVNLSKKDSDEYIKSVTKKLKEYLKGGSKGEYDTNPKQFPKGNGQLEKMKKKAYIPSEAVEEFIEEFAYSPGMENLQYDEIKPNDEWIEMNIEGSSKTGNSSEYANAEKTDLGKKINEKRKRNLYGVEKNGSYKRVKQPVDSAGEGKGEKQLKNMFKKLDEGEQPKDEKLLNEELSKMSDLMKYSQKTQ